MTRLLLLLTLAACGVERSLTHNVFNTSQRDEAAAVFSSGPIQSLLSLFSDSEQVFFAGYADRANHSGITSACRDNYGLGNPMVWPCNSPPKVGRPFIIHWTTLVVSAPREWPVFIVASQKRVDPVDITELGCNGCWLEVTQDYIFWPGSSPDNLFYRPIGDEGKVYFQWTPNKLNLGDTWFFQLVCIVPRDVMECGFLLAPAIEITVGN